MSEVSLLQSQISFRGNVENTNVASDLASAFKAAVDVAAPHLLAGGDNSEDVGQMAAVLKSMAHDPSKLSSAFWNQMHQTGGAQSGLPGLLNTRHRHKAKTIQSDGEVLDAYTNAKLREAMEEMDLKTISGSSPEVSSLIDNVM